MWTITHITTTITLQQLRHHSNDNYYYYYCYYNYYYCVYVSARWFCHVDDDTYMNVVALVRLLRQYKHYADWYLGKPSISHPMTARLRGNSKATITMNTTAATVTDGFYLSQIWS